MCAVSFLWLEHGLFSGEHAQLPHSGAYGRIGRPLLDFRRICTSLSGIYGDRVRWLVLSEWRARGDAHTDSDYRWRRGRSGGLLPRPHTADARGRLRRCRSVKPEAAQYLSRAFAPLGCRPQIRRVDVAYSSVSVAYGTAREKMVGRRLDETYNLEEKVCCRFAADGETINTRYNFRLRTCATPIPRPVASAGRGGRALRAGSARRGGFRAARPRRRMRAAEARACGGRR